VRHQALDHTRPNSLRAAGDHCHLMLPVPRTRIVLPQPFVLGPAVQHRIGLDDGPQGEAPRQVPECRFGVDARERQAVLREAEKPGPGQTERGARCNKRETCDHGGDAMRAGRGRRERGVVAAPACSVEAEKRMSSARDWRAAGRSVEARTLHFRRRTQALP
jgi:hypothetical protein